MRNTRGVLLVFIGLILTGCNVMVMKSASATDEEKAKLFVPDSAKALVYVFRDNSFLGRDLTSQLVVNKVAITKNKSNEFNIVSLSPGKYDFFSVSSNELSTATALIHNSKKTPVPLTVEAGNIYFLQEVFKAMGGFSLKVVSQKEAEPLIKKGKLVALHQV